MELLGLVTRELFLSPESQGGKKQGVRAGLALALARHCECRQSGQPTELLVPFPP